MSERDPQLRDAADLEVDRAWREMSREEPPAELDEAIRAAARREAATGAALEPARPLPSRTGRGTPGWLRLAAAAGVAAMAFGLIRLQLPEPDAPAIEQSSTTPRPPPPTVPETGGPARDDAAARQAPERGHVAPPPAADSSEAPATPAAPAASASPPAPAAPAALAAPAAPAAEASRAAVARESISALPDASVSPADFVVRIQSLLEQGDRDGAAAALRAFRSAHPGADALLPAELRAWAEGIGPD